jgi:hypothetical protein
VPMRILTGGGSSSHENFFRSRPPSHSDPSRHRHASPPMQVGFTRPGQARGAWGRRSIHQRGARHHARCDSHVFTCQTAQRVPAARLRRGEIKAPPRGVGGAPTDARMRRYASVRHAMTPHARRLRGASRPITRDARLSALHRGGFWAPGPRFRLRHCLRSACSELLAAQVVVPGGRVPCLPNTAVTSRSRGTPHLAPPSGSSPETPLDEQGKSLLHQTRYVVNKNSYRSWNGGERRGSHACAACIYKAGHLPVTMTFRAEEQEHGK